MKKKILLISSANPYPIVTNGCARPLLDYQRTVFAGYDVHFVATKPRTWAPLAWFHGPARQGRFSVERLLELDFAFAFFVGFGSSDFSKQVMARVPSFCLTDTHPHPDLPEGVFKGILTHRAAVLRDDVLLCSGIYNSEVFYTQTTWLSRSVASIPTRRSWSWSAHTVIASTIATDCRCISSVV
jgi:hypothetical protein